MAIKRKKETGRVLYKEKNNYGTIRIQDSYKFIPEALNSIAKDMLNLEGKEQFPHSFVNKDTIDYKGLIAAKKYFINVNKKDYLKMVDNQKGIWSIKENCLNYLKKKSGYFIWCYDYVSSNYLAWIWGKFKTKKNYIWISFINLSKQLFI